MLQFLFSPTKQFLYDSGKLLAGGKIYVYLKDTQILATLYDGETGEGKSNPIILDANGRASVKADDVNEYRLEIYTPYDTLVYTCNAFYAEGGEGGGTFIVRHDETLSGNGTSQNPLGVVNIPLAVDDTMTAYTDIIDGVNSLVLGVNGDWFNDTFGSALNDKVDWSSFSACCSSVKNELENKLDSSSFDLSNYYNKQETNNLFENYYNKQEIDETVNVINELKQDKLTFDYNENSAISAINGSALAGKGGGEGDRTPWISGSKTISSMGYLQPGQWFQAISSFDLNGVKNHHIGMKGASYNFPTTAMFYDWLDLGQYMPQIYFDNFISGTYNPNMKSLFSSAGWMMVNKLDISAFTAWSAEYTPDEAETYTVSAGNWINISADDNEKVTTISVTGLDTALVDASGTLNQKIDTVSSTLTDTLTGFSAETTASLAQKKNIQNNITLTSTAGDVVTAIYQNTNGEVSADFAPMGESFVPWISGTKSIADTQTLTGDMLVQVLSSFDLSGYKNHSINVKGGMYRFPNNNEIASGINQTNTFLTQSAFNNYTNVMSNHLSILYEQDGYLSGRINELSSYAKEVSSTVNSNSANWNNVSNKLDTTSFSTVSGTFLTSHQTIPSAKWEDASDKVIANSAQWANNDGDSAVNNWVYNNSANCETTNTTVGTNSNFWSNTCFVVMDNSASWGQGGNPFPITGKNGNTTYTYGADCSSFYLSNSVSRGGSVVSFYNNYINFESYPSTDVSASWYDIIKAANTKSNCYCIRFTNSLTSVSLENYSAYDKVTVVHSNQYKPNCKLHWKGYTKTFPSGVYCEMVKGTNDQNQTDWFFTNSGRINNLEWD